MYTQLNNLYITREDPYSNVGTTLISSLVNDLAERYHEIADEIINCTYYPEHAPEKGAIFVVVYIDSEPVGCAAIHLFKPNIAEVKRLYVIPKARGKGISKAIMKELEDFAMGYGYERIILETGIRQPEAVSLYKKIGYKEIPIYEGITDLEYSICFEKVLIDKT